MAGENSPDPKEGAKPDPTKETGTKPDPNDAELGAGGIAALRAERARAEAAERKAADAEKERDELKARTQTEAEKAIEAAKKEGAAEATLTANRRIVKSEVRALCAGKVSDPEDAALLLGDLDRFIVKGEVDTKAISTAIDELVKAKPYLAPGKRPAPLPGGGATQSTGVSLNDEIRRRIRGG